MRLQSLLMAALIATSGCSSTLPPCEEPETQSVDAGRNFGSATNADAPRNFGAGAQASQDRNFGSGAQADQDRNFGSGADADQGRNFGAGANAGPAPAPIVATCRKA